MKVFYNFLIYIFFIKQGISEKKTIREKLRFDKTDQGNTVCMYVYLYLKKKNSIDNIEATITKNF